MKIKCGNGFDAHRFAEDRKLIIGGVELKYELGLAGHSDADVLTHAIIDSFVGVALGMDIGNLFPDNDEQYKDVDSILLLKRALELVKLQGSTVSCVDATIIAEKPKMAPYIIDMRKTISSAMGLAFEDVTIKATTTEKMGFTGRGEGIAAIATATVIKE